MCGEKKKTNLGLVMAVYLLGIFMGALDTGIVTPARTVIQNNLGVDDQLGVWMITIYTLAYAASIPIMGKLADRAGRKYIYLLSISLFAAGSLFCGLAQNFESFELLLIARVVQAIGGGGIVPVATAEFGTTFPEEKRGVALGLVGGVYGVANIFGASVGSAILDIFGANNWQFIFYINLPISAFIIIAGFAVLPNTKEKSVKKIDGLGIGVLTVMILSLMYGLRNIDFFDLGDSLTGADVYPFLLAFVLLLPLFILVEKRAEDPVINLSYFKNSRIVITLVLSFITGIIIIGMIFIPQFCENSMRVASGKGGYFVIILGLFAGIGAPVSGKLIDKYGVKLVLGIGFAASIAGSLFLILAAADHPNWATVIISLVLIGTGIGFTMGTPLNYMMLDNTKLEESNSALATLSLIRSVGTAIAPAIMVGFIAHAGVAVQGNVMDLLPQKVSVPKLPYAQELTAQMDALKSNPQTKEQFKDINMPDLDAMTEVKIDMSGNGDMKISDDLLELLQGSDVTTIVKNTKTFTKEMFDQMTPSVVKDIQDGIEKGIDGLKKAASEAANSGMPSDASTGSSAMGDAASGGMPSGAMSGGTSEASSSSAMSDSMSGTDSGAMSMATSMNDTLKKMTTMRTAVPKAFKTAEKNYVKKIDKKSSKIEKEFQNTLNGGFKQVYATVAISSVIGLVLLLFYKTGRRKKIKEENA